jgi:hypothetical protein
MRVPYFLVFFSGYSVTVLLLKGQSDELEMGLIWYYFLYKKEVGE